MIWKVYLFDICLLVWQYKRLAVDILSQTSMRNKTFMSSGYLALFFTISRRKPYKCEVITILIPAFNTFFKLY